MKIEIVKIGDIYVIRRTKRNFFGFLIQTYYTGHRIAGLDEVHKWGSLYAATIFNKDQYNMFAIDIAKFLTECLTNSHNVVWSSEEIKYLKKQNVELESAFQLTQQILIAARNGDTEKEDLYQAKLLKLYPNYYGE